MAATNRPDAAAKTPARRPAPKRTAAPKPPVDDLPPEDLVADDALKITTTPRKPGRRVVIFYVDGKPYSVPEDPPANVTFNYFDAIRRHGAMVAGTWLLETMLGTEGYNVLRSQPDLTDEQLAQVLTKVTAQLGKGPKE